MKIFNTNFRGLKIIKGITHYDKRGYFRETFKNSFFKDKNFIFWLMSKSKKNVIRGLHFQKTSGSADIFPHKSNSAQGHSDSTRGYSKYVGVIQTQLGVLQIKFKS